MKIIHHKPKNSVTSGPYFPAVEVQEDNIKQLFVSGQGTKDPVTGERFLGEIKGQAIVVMDNLKNVVEGSGYSMDEIVKVTIFLINMSDFEAVNKVYQSYFSEGQYPARSTVAVKELPGGQGVEIDAIAFKK
ncbi:RidA family protein [Gillisia sp. JM1]|uniref:RidA family protein n=1 Tax=Gillisia sp. JM1 TaxID=1283286 RepID=UPI0004252595|nr:RidA family protein [Gillisia sp. JM1]